MKYRLQMRRLSIICATLVLLTSCYTKRQAEMMCAARTLKDSTRIKDSLVVRYHDSLVPVAAKVGPDVQVKSPCDSIGQLKVFDIKETKNGITTELKSDGKTITASCREDAYKLLFKNAIRISEAWHSAFKQVVYKAPCDKKHHSGWDTFCNWFTIIVLALLAIFAAYKMGVNKITWLTRLWP